ncbi:MAG TPA: TonB-dependent receptor [Bacteroidales bacterium]
MKKYFIASFLLFQVLLLSAQTGRIEGKIFDKSTNEPLPFVNLVINGTTIGSVSDFEGNFSFSGLQPGFVKLKASFVGYSTFLSADILVTNAKPAYIELFMEPSSTKLDEVVITVSPFERPKDAPLSMQKIGIAEIESNPGSNRDISKVIQSYPGVSSTVSFRNDILVRGGGPNENVYFLDEIQIPNINHFQTQGASGGAVGIINSDQLKSVDFYSGSFPAVNYNMLSSVFDLKLKEGNPDKAKFLFSIGASEIAFSGDGPAGKKSDYVFSIRRSYLQFLFSALQLPFLPTFTDYQFKWRTKINQKNEFKIISIGALDQFVLNTGIKDPTEQQEYILSYLPVNNQWSYAIGGVYKHYGRKNVQTVVLSRNMLNNSSYKYTNNDESQGKIFDYLSQEIENKLRFENTSSLNGYQLTVSASMEYVTYNINTTQEFYFADINAVDTLQYQSDISFFKYGLSAQVNKQYFNEKLLLSLGIRADANTYDASMNNLWSQFSPRFSAKYSFLQRWAASVSIGRYYQLPPYTSMGFKDNNNVLVNKENNISYIQSDQLSAGIEFNMTENVQFTAEGFGKNYNDYPFTLIDSLSLATLGGDFGVVGNEPVKSIGKGRAFGFELMNRTRISNKLNMIVSYTFFRSEFQSKTGEYVPTNWDNQHVFIATATYNFKKNWSFGAKWRYAGGLPYTPYDLEKSSLVEAWDVNGKPYFDYDEVNSLRLSSFNQLDVRVDKKFFFQKWSLMVYLDIQNLYNYQSEEPNIVVREQDSEGNYITVDDGTRYVLKEIPSYAGTVLPTVGIMIGF